MQATASIQTILRIAAKNLATTMKARLVTTWARREALAVKIIESHGKTTVKPFEGIL